MDDRDEPWHGRLTKQDSLGSPGDGCRTQGMFDTLAGAGKENVTKMTVDRLALNVAMITENWWVGKKSSEELLPHCLLLSDGLSPRQCSPSNDDDS